MVNVSQRGNPSLLREQELNEQMIKDLTDDSDFGMMSEISYQCSFR